MSVSSFELQRGGQDYSTWRAPRPEPVNVRGKVVESLLKSGRHLYLDPALEDKISIREMPLSEGNLTIVDAVRASTLIDLDERSAPQTEAVIKQAAIYAQALAEGAFPQGLTMIQGDPILPAMYKAQKRGTGSDTELTLFFARDQIFDPLNTGGARSVVVVNGFSRKDGIGRIESKLELLGYDPKQANGRSGRGRR